MSAWLAAGGLWGIASTLWTALSVEIGPGVHAAIRVPLFGLFPFFACFAAGALLWLGGTLGDFLAPLLLSAQLFSFHVGDVEYVFSVGAGLFIGFDGWALAFVGRLGSRFIAAFGEPAQDPLLLFNVLPLALLVFLLRSPPSDRPTAP